LYHKSKQFFFKQKKFYTMQKVIIIIAAIFFFTAINSSNAQVNTTDTKVSATPTKQDTLVISNPNTIILYQGIVAPVVYVQPNAQQVVPTNAMSTQKSSGRGSKIALSAVVGGLAGLVIGGSVASNNVEPSIGGIITSPLMIMAGAFTGSLIGTSVGVGFGIALSK
jgi:spore germination protein YaaH